MIDDLMAHIVPGLGNSVYDGLYMGEALTGQVYSLLSECQRINISYRSSFRYYQSALYGQIMHHNG